MSSPSVAVAAPPDHQVVLCPQEEEAPALMILKRALTLLFLMASRQAATTWFLGFPTGRGRREGANREGRKEKGEYSRLLHGCVCVY